MGRFYFEPSGILAEYVAPTSGPRRAPYVHRCTPKVFEGVCHLIHERDTFTLEELVDEGGLPSTQAALALRFLHEHGLLERCHPRRNRRTEDSILLSAMVCWHALREEVRA